ncbi:MAG: DNA polymerase III subunit delta [Firmicutes bacterium]|nr:DNA polymerase III subunit delta [Bacillota bacterium]
MAGFNDKKEHAFKLFSSDLKTGNFSPVLLMYGPEEYLTGWAVDCLVKEFVNSTAMSLDYAKLSDDNMGAQAVLDACNTFSMFSERRVVWADNFSLLKTANPKGFTQQDKEKIIEYTKNPNEGTLLILSADEIDEKSDFVRELKKLCRCYNFDKLDYGALAAFAEKRFRSEGVNISRDILKYMIDETGYFNKETEYRLFNLINDIKKIVAFGDGQTVKEEDVSATLRGDMDTFVFNFLDAVSNNRKEQAFGLLHNILASGSDVFSIAGLLINHFELILEVKEFKQDGMNLAAIAGTMKIHEFRIKKAMTFADKFTAEKLKSVLSQLYEIDINIKTGMLEPNLALEILVGRI